MRIDLGLGHIRIQQDSVRTKTGSNEYTPPAGIAELRLALAEREGISIDELCITVGATLGLTSIFASLPRYSSLLCPLPYYPAYVKLAKHFGIELLFYNTFSLKRGQSHVSELERLIKLNTRAIIVNWPGNPTGAMPDDQELRDLALFVQRHDLLIISDEVYREFVLDPPNLPNMRQYFERNKLISVRSFSKEYGLAGERVGYLIAASRVIEELVRIHWTLVLSPPLTPQRFALELLRTETSDRLPQWRTILRESRDQVSLLLTASPRLRAETPKAGLFFWIEVTQCPFSADRIVRDCFAQTGVTVISGSVFGVTDPVFVRASFACKENEALQGFTRFRDYIESFVPLVSSVAQ